jgi:hypothetical protein
MSDQVLGYGQRPTAVCRRVDGVCHWQPAVFIQLGRCLKASDARTPTLYQWNNITRAHNDRPGVHSPQASVARSGDVPSAPGEVGYSAWSAW